MDRKSLSLLLLKRSKQFCCFLWGKKYSVLVLGKSSNCHVKEEMACSHTPLLSDPQQTPKATSVPAPEPTRTQPGSQWVSLGVHTVSRNISCCLYNNFQNICEPVFVSCSCRSAWGDRPRRDHTQETRDHRAWIHSFLQWAPASFCRSTCYLLFLDLFRFSPLNNTELSSCHEWLVLPLCSFKAALWFSVAEERDREREGERKHLDLLYFSWWQTVSVFSL